MFNWLSRLGWIFGKSGSSFKTSEEEEDDPAMHAILTKLKITTYVRRLINELITELGGKIHEPYGVKLMVKSISHPLDGEDKGGDLVSFLVQVQESSSKVYSLERTIELKYDEAMETEREEFKQEIIKFVIAAMDGEVSPDAELWEAPDEDFRPSF